MTIYGGTFLGGPLVGIYCLAENFKVLGDLHSYKNTWIYGLSITFLIFGITLWFPIIGESIHYAGLPIFFGTVTMGISKIYQEKKMEKIMTEHHAYGLGRSLVITFIGTILTLICFFLMNIIINTIKIDTYTYGNNMIITQTVSKMESDKMADNLMKGGLFIDNKSIPVTFNHYGNIYELRMAISKPELINNSEFNEELKNIRDVLQGGFQDNVHIVVVNDDNIVLETIQ